MSRFKRQMERGGLADYEKQEIVEKKKRFNIDTSKLTSYVSLRWLQLTPTIALKIFAAYMVVAILVEGPLVGVLGDVTAAAVSHGLITSLATVILLNGEDGEKAKLPELIVRYIMMGIIFGLATGLSAYYLF